MSLSFYSLTSRVSAADAASASASLADGADPASGATPNITKIAIACIVLFFLLALIRTWWYGARRAPVQGSGIGVPRSCGAGRILSPMTMLAFTFVGFVLKIAALGVDTWCVICQLLHASIACGVEAWLMMG